MDAELLAVIETTKSDLAHFSAAYGPNGLKAEDGSPCMQLSTLMAAESGPSGTWDGGDALFSGPIAGALLKVSSEYLASAVALAERGQGGPSLAPVVRSMFEAMGRAAWLLDPSQESVRVHSARFRLLWLDDLKRQELRKAVNQNTEAKTTEKARKDYKTATLQRFAGQEIHEETRDSGTILILCGQELPTLSGSVRALEIFDAGEWSPAKIYGTLSVLSHPTIAPIVLGHFNPEYERLSILLLDYASVTFRRLSALVATYLGLPPMMPDPNES